MALMKNLFKFLFVFLLGIILFSFAMFQGGFLSWFLFYSYLFFFLYYCLFLLYPLKDWKVQTSLAPKIAYAGNEVVVQVKIERKNPFPLPYVILTLEIPDSLHKKDLRKKRENLFEEYNLFEFQRKAKDIFFPWFRKKIEQTYQFEYVPRGEHQFLTLQMKTGDLFGFFQREHSFPIDLTLLVYPIERQVKFARYLRSFDGELVPYYTYQSKHTIVAGGVREYIPGDKFSWIDWKQTARKQEIMTKEFEQEKSSELLLVFYQRVRDSFQPITFEGAVELTLALFETLVYENEQVYLLSSGNEHELFSYKDALKNRGTLRHHFAKVQPVKESFLATHLHETLHQVESQYMFLVITTIVDTFLVQTLEQSMVNNQTIIVIYIQGSQSIPEKEQRNMQFLRSKGVEILLMTDQQLSFDPIEVKF